MPVITESPDPRPSQQIACACKGGCTTHLCICHKAGHPCQQCLCDTSGNSWAYKRVRCYNVFGEVYKKLGMQIGIGEPKVQLQGCFVNYISKKLKGNVDGLDTTKLFFQMAGLPQEDSSIDLDLKANVFVGPKDTFYDGIGKIWRQPKKEERPVLEGGATPTPSIEIFGSVMAVAPAKRGTSGTVNDARSAPMTILCHVLAEVA
ncbi:hypothetical protein K402DRAFT_402282 [Aulographum hederae CBS 113979]|uniref:Tesmin/TSO1-like CXC domain-containing protein n=1 Tax=Aulographum hederae CBS 113979 TaxID=1176131 RepID=A0A6G1H7Q1_9PEZI|nr:hypothetical protein K402DRAFT_402282 [Aulographum hederae CBS 113979]